MNKIDQAAVALFKAKAAPVSIFLTEVKGLTEAMDYAVEVCEKKEPFRPLLASSAAPDVPAAPGVPVKIMAAPELSEPDFLKLTQKGGAKGFSVIRDGLRRHLAGIDVGFTEADLALADTATSVLACQREDTRLATMICEIHVMALAKSKIAPDSARAENFLNELMKSGVMYTAFISGCSRTSDIERVLTLGVHGPLELHVALMEE
ncbi:MAG: lactate utilization protein [Candidatus Adiutrix sp.]|jgi:L-lactate dehydrogenase complex protein LldG|nr:lactate utilization protein [Candidatus Adiutrix sp.]